MIKDTIKNTKNYYNLSEKIKKGLEYLETTDLTKLENGRYDISDGIYVNIQDYTSKPFQDGKYEAHRKYIDIQYIIDGFEYIGVGTLEDFEPITDFDTEKDIEFLKPKKSPKNSVQLIKIKKNEFMILYPNDSHMPQISFIRDSYIKKAVIKIPV